MIVKDKNTFNELEATLKFSRWLSTNYAFKMGLELHYGLIEPCIIIEKYMGSNLNDYKVFCFNGNPEFIWVDTDRFKEHKRTIYDTSWNKLPFAYDKFKSDIIKKPKHLELMLELARKLSQPFCFVRVDFYEIDGNLYFGELTFTSSSGRDSFYPNEYDYIYGQKITLPSKGRIPIEQIKKIWYEKG